MSVTIKRGIGVLSVLVVALLVWIMSARAGLLTHNEARLRALYQLQDSKYLIVDGQQVHYVDRGRGPAIVLLHGSFGSLRMWNDWDAELSSQYRVIRFDRPRMGLSGPAALGRTDTEHELRIIAVLTSRLGVERFFLVGTSSAGVAAAAYAADHPQQVRGLLLANIAVGAFKPPTVQRPVIFRFLLAIDPLLKGWRSTEFWRQVLLANFHEPAQVTSELAREWADLNNRAQRMPAATFSMPPMAQFDRTIRDLERMTVPTLLLWSDHDHELPVETVGRRGLATVGSADKQLRVVSNCGHIMPLECGPESARAARAFFERIVAGSPMNES
ncbi:MAG TPA: alpha/beta hydrolase [Steroidobacteraceae bacterium]|nr:alpha/beta hydrolase [Steroidobacteraceae bacterium]HRX89703.1 alpha/beta hydrolase [Steroidobacteraceae bacterium]